MKSKQVTVDIATRVVSADEDFYIIHPGSDYSLYRDFKEKSVVFFEFPDLRLDFRHRPSRESLREAVVRSLDLADWIRGGSEGDSPSRNPEDYKGTDYGRRIGRYVGAIERLYYDLKPGTIVIVPGPSVYDDVLIGQIEGRPTTLRSASVYPGEDMPVRRVKWVGQKPRTQFRAEVREKFGTPNPITQLERSLREDILKAGFDQYVIGGVFATRLRTTEQEFSSFDDQSIQVFVNLISGAIAASSFGESGEGSIDFKAARSYLREHRDWAPDMAAAIESPGFIRFTSEHITPLVIAAIFAVAVSCSPGQPVPTDINVINSAVTTTNDDCAPTVQAHIAEAMKLMKFDDLEEACVDIRDAKEDAGISSSIRVIQESRAE